MNRSILVRQVAGRTGLALSDADAAVKAALEAVEDALTRGETVRLTGFGTFAPKERAARPGRNPRTGEEIAVPASRRVRFRPGNALLAAMNSGRG